MSRLTWVQPPDLLAHELQTSDHEGKDPAALDDVRRRWSAAGGSLDAPVNGVGQEGDASLRALAVQLLDELATLPPDPGLLAREPDGWAPVLPLGRVPVPVEGELYDRLLGAWTGRAAGCLLGKPVEKIPRAGIREILQTQGRWPLTAYFTAEGLPAEVAARWPWNRRSAPTSLVENIDGMPEDDDLNFPLIALDLLERHGSSFTTEDVADTWLASLPAGRVFTAERVAYRNLLLGLEPPATATHRNPFREWIGAQIRTDVYGWAHPGDPVTAAQLAWTDARLSHVRNGVYGAAFVAAACARSVTGGTVEDVLAAGLAVVPPASRYADAIRFGASLGALEPDEALDRLHAEYGHLHWVHVLNNAALTAYALTASGGDFATGITLAVTGGWDTDSVGATVGSLLGALGGVPHEWSAPLRDRLATSLPGLDGTSFTELAARTAAVVA
jgi:ADP-ribosylglycohydrolase